MIREKYRENTRSVQTLIPMFFLILSKNIGIIIIIPIINNHFSME